MEQCAFEERPDIKWRKEYAKGASLSRKTQPRRLYLAWCGESRSPRVKNTLAEKFIKKPQRATYASIVQREFLRLAEQWKEDTMHWSSVARMVSHPNYLRIVGLAAISKPEIERLLLEELRNEPDHWFAALTAITGEDPTSPDNDFDQAVESWLEWGHARGRI